MKVFLLKDIEKVGLANEIIKVSDGYAQNFLFPRKLAVLLTSQNEQFYQQKIKKVENRKEVIAEATSMLAEKIKILSLMLKRKVTEDGKLYGAVSQTEIVDLLAEKSISVSKNQIIFDKSIKATGTYTVIIKLSSRLQPALKLKVAAGA